MTDQAADNFRSSKKKAWTIYTLLAIAIVVLLVTVVAQDNEEMFFYGLMGSAVFYVFRPTDKFMNKQVTKFTGIESPEQPEEPSETKDPQSDDK